VETVRSFSVSQDRGDSQGQYHVLMHGTTIHGAQNSRTTTHAGDRAAERLHIITRMAASARRSRRFARAGRTAARRGERSRLRHADLRVRARETWKFFEIDQSMVDTARTPNILAIFRAASRI